jgi:hypothetical protein
MQAGRQTDRQTDRGTDRQTDMTKLIAIFLYFGNPPGKGFAFKFSEAFCAFLIPNWSLC